MDIICAIALVAVYGACTLATFAAEATVENGGRQ